MKVHLYATIGLGLLLILLLGAVALQPTAQAQAVCQRYVAGGGSDASDCSTATQPCNTVQYAIDQAVDGDRICVADVDPGPGPTVYPENIAITRSLVLDGKWQASCSAAPLSCTFEPVACDPDAVVLTRPNLGRVVTISGTITPTIDCFTITGGDAAGQGGDPDGNDAGGGIYSRDAAPILVNNVITANYGCSDCGSSFGYGGGIYLLNAPATAIISGNLIAHNVADSVEWGQGGGIMLRDSDAQVLHNVIQENQAGLLAGYGGGIAVSGGQPIIAENDILGNMAGQAGQGLGGGIYVWSSSPASIERNLIQRNKALSGAGDPDLISYGGGICYTGRPTATAIIRDNTLRQNTASMISPQGYGGGLFLGHVVSPSLVSGNLLEGNIAGDGDDGHGGGIYVDASQVIIASNQFLDNAATWAGSHGEGGGLYVNGGEVQVRSNTIVQNYGAGFPDLPSGASGYGGGIAISNSLTIVQDNQIVSNHATNAGNGGMGGGIYAFQGSLHVQDNTIAENEGTAAAWGFGGGLYAEALALTLEANLILDNLASVGPHGRGGGVRIASCPAFTLTNNIIARNGATELGSGLGIAASTAGWLAHNTLVDNRAGDGTGIHASLASDLLLYGNLVISHTFGISVTDPAASHIEARYTLFEANSVDYGPGVNSDDEIAGPAALLANYHLGPGSSAIDQVPALAGVGRDFDGDTRPMGARSDAGADESWLDSYLPLLFRDHTP
ncbi:MAG: right-handed parallel beta-helix repeat-containing protein [Anaerolineae bacterium]